MPPFQRALRDIDKINAYLRTLPRGTVKVAMKALGEYMLGDGSRGIRKYPPYKQVTRRRAYGSSFVSDRQRRYVMAKIRSGQIDPGAPKRTGRTQRGYMLRETRGGYGISIQNPEQGAYYTAHDTGQARLNSLVGWRKLGVTIQANMAGAIRAANAAVNRFLKSKG